jgi:hypothetical protein
VAENIFNQQAIIMLEKFILLPHLPTIPDDLVDLILSNNNDYINYGAFGDGLGRNILKDGQQIPSASNRIRDASDLLKHWITQNITRHWANAGTVITDAGRSVVGPHIDRIRNYSLLYPIATGGTNVSTVFYRLKDPKKSRADFFYNDISELEEIARVQVPEHTWCILDTKTIHAVEGLESTRITVQVGLWDYMGLPDIH